MTDWAMQSDSVDSRILSRRLGAFVRRQASAKQLSLLIDCDERTAFKIRSGDAWPIARHWLRLWLEFGDDLIEAVFYIERAEARLKREAEQREQSKRQRIEAATLAEPLVFGMGAGVGQADGWAEDPAELGPPNLDLFDTTKTTTAGSPTRA